MAKAKKKKAAKKKPTVKKKTRRKATVMESAKAVTDNDLGASLSE